MNDSQQEGFYQPSIETIIKTLSKTQSFKLTKKAKQFPLRPTVCAHYQLSLFQYPREIDTIQFTQQTTPYPSLQFESLELVVRGENLLQPLSECFPRNLECIYNKFREKTTYKRDLTLIIRNVSRLVKDESLGTFTQNRQNSLEPIIFSSDFEGGNLHFVYKERKNQIYYLLLQNDVNTHGFNFWFYFNIRSKVRRKCIFVIVNLSRVLSFACQSLIIVYNNLLKEYEKGVPFKSIETRYCRCDSELPYWGLMFQYELYQDCDLYFSLALPYSYSRLNRILKPISENAYNKNQIKIDQSLKTPLGNTIHIVQFGNQEKSSIKKTILILARQHPCETVGSFACQSIIKILTENNQISKSLLKRFKIIIVPMVNVDGVIHGNSRTNLLGYDLNRSWQKGKIMQSSECDQLWKYFEKIYSQQNIIWTIDLHGHSKQHGFFIYFCEKNDKNMIMSHILSKKNQTFRPDKCVYQVGADKKQSVRAQLYQRLKIKNVLTIEISMFGFLNEQKSFKHYRNQDLHQIGKNILESLLETERIFQKKSTRFRTIQQIINFSLKNLSNKEIDSESDPQGDYLKNEERNQLDEKTPIEPRKHIERKKTKTEGNKQRKINSQFSTNLRTNLSLNSGNNFSKISNQKLNSQKNLLFNLTFVSRNFPMKKREIQTSQLGSRPKVLIIEEGRQISRFIPRSENSSHQSDFTLKRSLQMRKRIKLAFENRIKSQRKTNPNLGLGLFTSNQIKCVLYPTLKDQFPEGKKKEKNQLKKNFKSKKEQIKELRNKQFGANIFNRFQNSFYLKEEK